MLNNVNFERPGTKDQMFLIFQSWALDIYNVYFTIKNHSFWMSGFLCICAVSYFRFPLYYGQTIFYSNLIYSYHSYKYFRFIFLFIIMCTLQQLNFFFFIYRKEPAVHVVKFAQMLKVNSHRTRSWRNSLWFITRLEKQIQIWTDINYICRWKWRAKQLLFISRIPKSCAIPQLVSAALNPKPIVDQFRWSHQLRLKWAQ